MVICQYFLNGNCHFKNNCKNEHVDVRATLKQEADAALKGKQWPLSCFGPFKEKVNLLGDECDQSFEEIRLQCTEARANNTFHIYEQQLMQKIQEANAKMQAIFNVNKDVMNAVVNIYNEPTDAQSMRPFDAGQASAGGFGGAAAANNAFSIFGGSTSKFGAAQPNAASIFGGGTTAATPGFAGGAQQPQTPQSIFGQAATNNASIFGGSTTTTQNNAFGAAATFGNTSTFGAAATPAFGAAPSSNIFGNSFGAAATPGFGAQPVAPANTFGSPSAFGAAATPAYGTASVFGQSTAQPPPLPPTTQNSIFNQSAPANNSIFSQGATGGSDFAASQAFGAFNQQQPTAQPTFTSASNPAFGTQPNTFQPPFNPAEQPQQFAGFNEGTNNAEPPKEAIENPLYSKLDTLSPEDLAAFQSDEFVLGKIPSVPPPRELCH